MSVRPPGGAATTMRTVREGYCCAMAVVVMQHVVMAKSSATRTSVPNHSIPLALLLPLSLDAITSANC